MSTTAVPSTRARLTDVAGVIAVLLGLVVGLLPPAVAGAAHGAGPFGPGDFDIDGNATGATHDWPALGGVFSTDGTGSTDDIFKGGMVEGTYPNWEFVGQSTPQKSDLLRLYVDSQVEGGNSFLWLGAERDADNGSTQVTVEFNQADGDTLDLGSHYRVAGDFYITWNFPGKPNPNDPLENVTVKVGSWPSGAVGGAYPTEVTLGSSLYRYAVGDADGADGVTPSDFTFIELELDLNALFGDGGPLGSCGQFGAVSFRTESSGAGGKGGDESTLKDVAGPFPIDLDTCASVELRKVDDDGNGLAGAEFAVTEGHDSAGGVPVATCTTAADGGCNFGEMEPGDYTLDETSVPAGYRKADGLPLNFTVAPNTPLDLGSFTDPRIPYTIDVQPDGRNAVGNTHAFTVSLDDDLGPVANADIALSWDGVGSIQSIDPAGPDASSCTTDSAGECSVVVISTDAGAGDLTATFTTPYQHTTVAAPGNTTYVDGGPGTSPWSSISDDATKTWVGYVASIEADGTNLRGDAHTFTATVWEVDGEGDPDGVLAEGVTVTVAWDGPAGSSIDSLTCLTLADGTCEFVVDSDVNGGEGTITIVQLDGVIAGIGQQDDEALSDTSPTEATDGQLSAVKTWRIYRATIDDDSVNPAGQSHTFTVTAEYSDDNGDSWSPAVGVTVAWTGPTPDGQSLPADSTCDDGTDGLGQCTIVVTSDSPGTGTVTVTGVNGDLVPGGTTTESFDTIDDSATKVWLDFIVEVDGPFVNLVGEAETFTVTVKKSDDGQTYVPVAAGTTVQWTNAGDDRVVSDGCSIGGTDADGTCEITVNSAATGTFTITVTGIDEYAEFDEPADVTFTSPAETSKTWVDYRASIEADGLNLVRDEHKFTVTAEVDDGTGWTAVADGTVVTVTHSGLPSATVDQSDCADGTTGGTCVVLVDSDVAGTLSVQVSTVENLTAVDSPVEAVNVSDGSNLDEGDEATATKTWAAFRALISPDSLNVTGDSHDFVVTAQYTVDGSTWLAVPDGSAVGTTSSGVGEVTDTTCDSTTGGTCTVTVSSDVSGDRVVQVWFIDPAEITVGDVSEDFGTVLLAFAVEGIQPGTDVDVAATKTWASYTLELTPETAVNLLDGSADDPERDHVITVILRSDDAVNAPVAGQPVAVSLSGDTGTITAVEAGSIDAGDRTATCTTDADGACDVTITSAAPGTAVLSATYQATVGESDPVVVESNDAEKVWTTFRVRVEADAVNVVGNPHTFTVTVEQSNPAGDCDGDWCPVAEAFPTSVVSGSASITDDDCAISGTGVDGTCTVTIVSNTVESVTLTSSYEASVGQTTATFSADAGKSWVDFLIDVDPPDAQNLVGTEHVFTVTLQTRIPIEGGTQTLPISGAVPDIELLGVGTIKTDGCAAGTDDSGQCTVTITSPSPGDSTLVASFLGTTADDAKGKPVSDTGDKLWVAYELVLDPELATNAVGDAHTFTAKLTVDTGDGFGPAADEVLQFSLDGVGDVIGGDADGDLACVTDEAGMCQLVVVSDVGGTTTVGVEYGALVGETSATLADEGVKLWADIDLVKTAVVGDGFDDGDLAEDPGTGLPTLFFTSSDRGPKTAVFEYTITNTGAATLSDVVLTDDRLGTIIDAADGVTLAPGESTTVRAREQFDYDDAAGGLESIIVNVGVVTASGDDGSEVQDTDDAAIQLIAQQSSILLDLQKEVVVGAGDVSGAGGPPTVTWSQDDLATGATKVVRYRFTITNVGPSRIIDVELSDPMISDEPLLAVSDGVTLDPGESTVVEVDHVLTIDEAFPDGPIAGEVPNVATARGANETRDSFDEDVDDAVVFVQVVLGEVEERQLPATGVFAGGLASLSLLFLLAGGTMLLLERRRFARR